MVDFADGLAVHLDNVNEGARRVFDRLDSAVEGNTVDSSHYKVIELARILHMGIHYTSIIWLDSAVEGITMDEGTAHDIARLA